MRFSLPLYSKKRQPISHQISRKRALRRWIWILSLCRIASLSAQNAEIPPETAESGPNQPIPDFKNSNGMETDSEKETESESEAETAGKTESEPEPETEEERAERFRRNVLRRDIATGNYLELQTWANSLGLPPQRDLSSLRDFLYRHFELTPKAEEKDENAENDLKIQIESAQKAEVLSIKRQNNSEEDQLEISGRVKISILDQKTKLHHIVISDRVIFNRQQKTIGAIGNIVYEKKSSDSDETEKFFGDSMIFEVESWQGIIFYGVFSRGQKSQTERPQDIASNPFLPADRAQKGTRSSDNEDSLLNEKIVTIEHDLSFFFQSEELYRNGDENILILEDANVVTEQSEDSLFKMRFARMWILGESQWAMLSATLYIGNIPVLYIPYYYYNSDQLLFHPVFGFMEPYGNFVKTTTYLIGSPKQQSSGNSFSFLPIGGNSSAEKFRLRGFYLVPDTDPDEEEEENEADTNPDDYLKLMLDYYSYIGFMGGIEGTSKSIPLFDEVKLSLSLAYSYALENREGPLFQTNTPYILQKNGGYGFYHIKSSLFGIELPIRYGTSLSFRSKDRTVTSSFSLYSDSDYSLDFSNRKENFDLIEYAFQRVQKNEALDTLKKKDNSISNYRWELSFNPSIRIDNQFFKTFSLKAYAAIQWKSKTNSQKESYDPTRNYFYPEGFYMPEINLRFGGDLFPITTNQPASSRTRENTGFQLSKDWKTENPEKTDSPESVKNPILVKPPLFDNINLPEKPLQDLSFRTNYQIKLDTLLWSETDSKNWKAVSDITFNNKTMRISNNGTLDLAFDLDLFQDLVQVNLKQELKISQKDYFGIDKSTGTEAAQKLRETTSTKEANYIKLNGNLALTTRPLQNISWLKSSSVSYNIYGKILEYGYQKDKDAFILTLPKLNEGDETARKSISRHNLNTSVKFDFSEVLPLESLQFTVLLSNDLPPIQSKHDLSVQGDISFFQWSNKLTLKLEQSGEKDPKFYWEPILYESSYKPIDQVTLSNKLILNLGGKENKNYISKEEFSFKLWGLSGTFQALHTVPYRWDKSKNRWRKDGEKKLLPNNLNLNFSMSSTPQYFWKNRIAYTFTFSTGWTQNLIKINFNSSLTATFKLTFYIYQFINLQISYSMENKHLFLFYPGAKDFWGLSKDYNLLTDILQSLSIWNENALRETHFKMKDIRVLMIHQLKNWDLILEYIGKPVLKAGAIAWDYGLGIYIRWIPIPLIKRSFTYEDDLWKSEYL